MLMRAPNGCLSLVKASRDQTSEKNYSNVFTRDQKWQGKGDHLQQLPQLFNPWSAMGQVVLPFVFGNHTGVYSSCIRIWIGSIIESNRENQDEGNTYFPRGTCMWTKNFKYCAPFSSFLPPFSISCWAGSFQLHSIVKGMQFSLSFLCVLLLHRQWYLFAWIRCLPIHCMGDFIPWSFANDKLAWGLPAATLIKKGVATSLALRRTFRVMGTCIFQGLAVGPPKPYEILTHFISREQTERKSGPRWSKPFSGYIRSGLTGSMFNQEWDAETKDRLWSVRRVHPEDHPSPRESKS